MGINSERKAQELAKKNITHLKIRKTILGERSVK